jgi:hypothetical protein
MFNDVEASHSLQSNALMKLGVPCCLFMKRISKHSINCLLQTIQRMIIKHYKDWHDRVTSQNTLGIFSFSLVYSKKLSLSTNIYLSSLLLAQSAQGQSFNVIQSQIKYFLKVADESNDPKVEFLVYASGNLCFQISNLVMNWDKANKAKGKHTQFQKLSLDPYMETWKTPLLMHYSLCDVLLNCVWVVLCNIMDISDCYSSFSTRNHHPTGIERISISQLILFMHELG